MLPSLHFPPTPGLLSTTHELSATCATRVALVGGLGGAKAATVMLYVDVLRSAPLESQAFM